MTTGWIGVLHCELSSDERRLCAWVAQHARAGRTRAYYWQAAAALGLHDAAEITALVRGMRERLDDIHEMVQSPIVNTLTPYFDIHPDADHIWDRYGGAEEGTFYMEHADAAGREAPVLCAAAAS